MELLAKDLMSSPVRRLPGSASIREAAARLVEWGVSGAPVEDAQGRWIGMFSLSDLARHVQRGLAAFPAGRELETRDAPPPDWDPGALPGAKVSDLMTPGLYSVFPEASLREVVRTLTTQKVHRLAVLSEAGAILGIITTMDVLRRLA